MCKSSWKEEIDEKLSFNKISKLLSISSSVIQASTNQLKVALSKVAGCGNIFRLRKDNAKKTILETICFDSINIILLHDDCGNFSSYNLEKSEKNKNLD